MTKFDSTWGIEIEEHRANVNTGSLSMYPHDDNLGDRRTQSTFQTDFAESQEEVVTGVHDSPLAALAELTALQRTLARHLQADEVIWPLSMPPFLDAQHTAWVENTFERFWYADYRQYLQDKYGIFQHLQAGVHVNYAPGDDLVAAFSAQHPDLTHPREALLIQQANAILNWHWLLIYLFGAAPHNWNDQPLLPANWPTLEPVRSWRSSQYGFTNFDTIDVPYTTLAEHVAAINAHLAAGDLYDVSEFYGLVRFKPANDWDTILDEGVAYLEIRLLDLNPFATVGVDERALALLHLILVDAATPVTPANSWANAIALSAPNAPLSVAQQAQATDLLARLAKIAPNETYAQAVSWAQAAVSDPSQTIAAQLPTEDLASWAMKQASAHRENLLK